MVKACSNPSIIRSLFSATLPDSVEELAPSIIHDAVRSLNPPVLVFVQSKERAKELYKELSFDNVKADVIHADLTQEQRENAVDNFRAGRTWVLIATDVIARGMDFKGVNCRSGRAGRSGEAITLYIEEDKPFLRHLANVMAASGCEVPSWILALPKLRRKKHRPQRDAISTLPEDNPE
ncbi:uncharacterized protein A4U43_C07F8770 [Asparagus officinalis]|uniref:RNA helicase n=1 Tax=Asparagus officinalis TaxID=4686 RepID=A0A5P1EFK0_ASPOF|nr:uncharacterized protein A4U43_C07F8770 [Asparagus officinalis]